MANFKIFPTPAEMIRHLDKFIYGQDIAKRDLATAVYRHYLNWTDRNCFIHEGLQFGKRHILILGPTGSGKTSMVRELADYLGVTAIFADAASLVEAGYVGGHFTDILRRLIVSKQGDVTAASQAIIFIDEIDKIRCQETGGRDVAGAGVQTSLLAPLDGCPVDVNVGDRVYTVDTTLMLFVCTGAFTGLPDIIRARLGPVAKMGFHTDITSRRLDDDEALARCELQDLRAYGMIPEFLGRLGLITAVKSLSRDDLVRVMKDTERSPLKRQVAWFKAHDIDLVVPDEALRLIADKAIADGTYVRGLDGGIAKLLAPFEWQLTELANDGYDRLIVTPEAVLGTTTPILERGSRRFKTESDATYLRRTAAESMNARSTEQKYSVPHQSSYRPSGVDRPDPEEPAYAS